MPECERVFFYYRQTRTVDCNAASEIRYQSGGLQFVLAQ